MRSIVEYINDEVILKGIVCEAKQMIDRIDVSLSDCDIKSLESSDNNITELQGYKEKHDDSEAFVIACKDIISGIDYARKNITKEGYKNAFIVLPLADSNIVLEIKFNNGDIKDGMFYIVGPKDVNIKSVVNISKSAFEFCKSLYFSKDSSNEDILKKVSDALEELKDKAVKKFNDSINSKSTEPTPDKSPYTLTKKKKFPAWCKHTYVKADGKDFIYKNTWNGEADIFVETVKKDGKNYYQVYMGDSDWSLNDGRSMMDTYYLTSLGQLDKFLEYTLKPARRKQHSEVGDDGEIHVWYTNMNKNLPASLKKDVIKDKKLIKELGFHHMDIFDLYK